MNQHSQACQTQGRKKLNDHPSTPGCLRSAIAEARVHQRARTNEPKISKIPYTTVAVTAAVRAKLAVAITRPTPTLRRDVVRARALRLPVPGPPRSHPE